MVNIIKTNSKPKNPDTNTIYFIDNELMVYKNGKWEKFTMPGGIDSNIANIASKIRSDKIDKLNKLL